MKVRNHAVKLIFLLNFLEFTLKCEIMTKTPLCEYIKHDSLRYPGQIHNHLLHYQVNTYFVHIMLFYVISHVTYAFFTHSSAKDIVF